MLSQFSPAINARPILPSSINVAQNYKIFWLNLEDTTGVSGGHHISQPVLRPSFASCSDQMTLVTPIKDQSVGFTDIRREAKVSVWFVLSGLL